LRSLKVTNCEVSSKLTDYKTPIQSVTLYNETLREKKRQEKELREELRKKFTFENPAATKERVNAGVFRMVYEHQVKSLKPQSVIDIIHFFDSPRRNFC